MTLTNFLSKTVVNHSKKKPNLKKKTKKTGTNFQFYTNRGPIVLLKIEWIEGVRVRL